MFRFVTCHQPTFSLFVICRLVTSRRVTLSAADKKVLCHLYDVSPADEKRLVTLSPADENSKSDMSFVTEPTQNE